MNLRSGLILFFLVFFSGAVNAGELCRWKLKEGKTEYKIIDVHNLDKKKRSELIESTKKRFNKRSLIPTIKLIPTIICRSNFEREVYKNIEEVKALEMNLPYCYTPWKGSVEFRKFIGKNYQYKKLGEFYKLISFEDKNNDSIKVFQSGLDLKYKQQTLPGIILGRVIYIRGNRGKDFLRSCDNYNYDDEGIGNPTLGWSCSRKGICTEKASLHRRWDETHFDGFKIGYDHSFPYGYNTYYFFNNEYREIKIVKKRTLTYEIKRLNSDGGASF